ncbi:hypothetical protein P3H15_32660 [Rhodococcus sp. T2V]|nr:hypothetical protein [Rhodococcus sp. T2V]MDF3309772.1 hypothetical protein [Rhodococcus sp. T2V]
MASASGPRFAGAGVTHYLCHPNKGDGPDCYRLVTIYNEPIGSRKDSAR